MPVQLFNSFEKASEEINAKQKHDEIKATFEELNGWLPDETQSEKKQASRLDNVGSQTDLQKDTNQFGLLESQEMLKEKDSTVRLPPNQ